MSAFGDPKAQQEMLRHLADTLVQEEVIDRMEQNEWRQGDPAPLVRKTEDNPQVDAATKTVETPAAADNPPATQQPTATVTATKQEIDWEALRGPDGKILGKYNDIQQATQGVANAVNMAKQSFSERDKLRAEVNDLRAKLNQPQSQAVTPITPIVKQEPLNLENVKSDKLAKVLAKVGEEGGLLDKDSMPDFLSGISEQAQLIAEQIVEKKLNAREAAVKAVDDHWNEVGQQMSKEYPDAQKHMDEIAAYVSSDPLVSAVVGALSNAGDDYRASEYAWKEYSRNVLGGTVTPTPTPTPTPEQVQAEITGAAREQVRQEEVDKARKDAGVLGSSAGGVHESVQTTSNEAEIADAVREMNATGLGSRWRSLTIGKELDNYPSIFGS